ncbi:MAG: DNA sulfur modification protein DndB [Gordonia sp. (in: high G+C Gram-positive bacteria)]
MSEAALEELRTNVTRPIDLQKVGLLTKAGKMEKITFTATIKEIAERFNFDRLLSRHVFDIDSDQPGNRDITDKHWQDISDYLLEDERPFLGTITVAMRRDQVELEPLGSAGEHVELAKLTIYTGAEKPILEDGQHRNRGVIHAWNQVKDIDEKTATAEEIAVRDRLASAGVTVEMLFEHERDVLSTIFVRMGSTKPIPPALVAVMDLSTIQNRLGAKVMRKSELFHNRTTYLGAKASRELAETQGRKYEPLYSADAVRNAAANIAGVGVRDRSPKKREDILEAIVREQMQIEGMGQDGVIDKLATALAAEIDYAYRTIPGWRELAKRPEDYSVTEFKNQYVHGTAAGLYTIATVIAAAKVAGLSPQLAVDAMAREVPWRRDSLRAGKDGNGLPIQVHTFFEGTLVKTAQAKSGEWIAGTAGARRDMYQEAARKVLRTIAKADPRLKSIDDLRTHIAVGLASAGRGRPRKAAAAVSA